MHNVTEMFQDYNEIEQQFEDVDAILNDEEEFLVAEELVKMNELHSQFMAVSEVNTFINNVYDKVKAKDSLSLNAAVTYLEAIQMKTQGELCESVQVGLENLSNFDGGYKEIALESILATAKKWGRVVIKFIGNLISKILGILRRAFIVYQPERDLQRAIVILKRQNSKNKIKIRLPTQPAVIAFETGKWDSIKKYSDLGKVIIDSRNDSFYPNFNPNMTTQDIVDMAYRISESAEAIKSKVFPKLKKVSKDELLREVANPIAKKLDDDFCVGNDGILVKVFGGTWFFDKEEKKIGWPVVATYNYPSLENPYETTIGEAITGIKKFLDNGNIGAVAKMGKKRIDDITNIREKYERFSKTVLDADKVNDETVRKYATALADNYLSHYHAMLTAGGEGLMAYSSVFEAIIKAANMPHYKK